jgi:hypothetical protein
VNIPSGEQERLHSLMGIAQREGVLLLQTDTRLFAHPFTAAELPKLLEQPDFSERTDAFVARFGRLQDLLGDKWLPAWLRAMQEPLGAVLENLDRAEKLTLIQSADEWLAVRKLRNLMVHEYLDQPDALYAALLAAHAGVPMLLQTVERMGDRTRPLLRPAAAGNPSP